MLVILVLCLQDWRTQGRVHPVYLWGLPLFAALEGLAGYLYAQHPAWWVAAARWMVGA